MTYAVRVPEDYVWLMGRFVAEGQAIVPGVPLMDIMTPEGIVETIRSDCWGIVAHVEGHRIFHAQNSNLPEDYEENDDEDDQEDGEGAQGRSSSGGMGVVFSKGDVICHIVARNDRSQAGAGLRPRYSESLRLRRENAAPR